MAQNTLQKGDFIEIFFIGKIHDTEEIFDSNIKEEIEKIPHINPKEIEKMSKPFIYALGEGMFLEGVDNYLIGKEIGKHSLFLKSEKAFGKRDPKSIQMVPKKVFLQHKINPVQGVVLNFDGKRGKILSVSGGRILVDFNHPLAGKDVDYSIIVKRKVEDMQEKLKAFNEFLFKQDFKKEIKEDKVIYEVEDQFKKFVEMFKDKFKEIFKKDLEIKTLDKEKKTGKEEKK